MKIKICKDGDYKSGTILDADEITAKEFITKGDAEMFTPEVEAKDAELIQETIAAECKKQSKKEKTKMSDTVEVKAVEVQKSTVGSEWKSMNEFLKAVRIAEEKGIIDPRLETKASAGMGEDSNGVGGYLVQHPLWNQEIFNAFIQSSVIAPKCRQFVAEPYANGLKFKQVQETSRASTTWFGGVRFYEVDEGVSITDSKPAFYQLDIPIKQLGALYYITQALIDDCPNLSQYVAGLVGAAFGQVVDREILFGTLGICTAAMGHLSTVSLPPSGTYPTAAELATMYNSVAQGYLAGSEWFMSHKQYANLLNLTAPAASGGAGYAFPIMTTDAANPAKKLLFGHPINIIEQAAATNAAGSIIFGNFSEYAIVTKGTMTPSVAMSLHVKFDSNQQTYRFITRIGGAPLLYSKVALPDGTNVSNLVST